MSAFPPWMLEKPLKGVSNDGVTFVWSRDGSLRVFEDGEEVPRVKSVFFDGTSAEDQTAVLHEILDDGSLVVRMLHRPFHSAFEKGHPDA